MVLFSFRNDNFFSGYLGLDLILKTLKRNNKKKKFKKSKTKNNIDDEISPLIEPVSGTNIKQNKRLNVKRKRVLKIVITGGPCAGKTTGFFFFFLKSF